MSDTVCASIITYNIDEGILEVVDSIINQVDYVVIVDNASNEKTIELLKQIENNEKIHIIFNTSNQGIAKALNQAVKVAEDKKLDWVLTLDHDSICNENMIENMLNIKKICENNRDIGILTPRIFEVNMQDYISNKNTESYFTEVKDCIQSGSLIKLELFKKLGAFNEELFIYHVDYEFCKRVIENGYRIIQCNNTTLYHEEGYKIAKKLLWKKTYYNNYSNLAIYYITRNTVYMSKKYSIFFSKRILKDFVYIILYDERRKEKLNYLRKGLLDGLINKFGKYEC